MSGNNKTKGLTPDDSCDAFCEEEPATAAVRIDVQQPVKHHRPAQLQIIEGIAAGQSLEWNFDRLVIGRGPSADLTLDDPTLCDWHIAFERKLSIAFCLTLDDHALLELNGVKVRSCALAGGDLLRLGDTVIKYIEGS